MFYKWMLEDSYPLFVLLYPFSILLMCRENLRRGIYLFCLFAVPFLIHSFVFQWKVDRYFLYVVTYFLLGVAFILKEAAHFVRKNAGAIIRISEKKLPSGWVTVVFVLALSAGTVLAGMPWLNQSMRFVGSHCEV